VEREPRMIELTPDQRELFEKKSFAFLATTGRDGSPQVTPVWVDLEDGRIAVNTAEGRVKHRNIQRDPRVAISAVDPDDPYRMVTVKGAATMTTDGADDHIDRLAKKYTGNDTYPWRQPGEVRVKVLIELESASGG
jgi:PPOX class probable F420-dependent enzyme